LGKRNELRQIQERGFAGRKDQGEIPRNKGGRFFPLRDISNVGRGDEKIPGGAATKGCSSRMDESLRAILPREQTWKGGRNKEHTKRLFYIKKVWKASQRARAANTSEVGSDSGGKEDETDAGQIILEPSHVKCVKNLSDLILIEVRRKKKARGKKHKTPGGKESPALFVAEALCQSKALQG